MTRPIVLGTGLVALDVVVGLEDTSPRLYAGGTCGNVLTILGYLGWSSFPVARLGDEPAARVLADLERFGVNLEYASIPPVARTPIIVQRIRRNRSGELFHSFSWNCPRCGSRLPGYVPVPAGSIEPLLPEIPRAKLFFFDRVSRGALTLARAAASKGAIIFFEPSGVGDPKLFQEALSIAHVIKYSQERMKTLGEWFDGDEAQPRATLLEIETLGRGGLRYRTRLRTDRAREWHHADAFSVTTFRDAAGCGDWTTAGIIDQVGRGGLAGLRGIGLKTLASAVRHGQALAAWNCGFEGARGGMYQLTREELAAIAKRITSERLAVGSKHATPPADPSFEKICVSCAPEAKARARASRAAR